MKYQVITITNSRILIKTCNNEEEANFYFKCAKYGFHKLEKVERIYLTINSQIAIEQKFD